MCNSAALAARRKYGRYKPYQRANVDQVPLPFVNDMDTTYEQKGATHVACGHQPERPDAGQAAGDRNSLVSWHWLATGGRDRRVCTFETG